MYDLNKRNWILDGDIPVGADVEATDDDGKTHYGTVVPAVAGCKSCMLDGLYGCEAFGFCTSVFREDKTNVAVQEKEN